jgi:histidinol-phosphate aminotransferase
VNIDRVEQYIRPGLTFLQGYDPVEPIDVLEKELGRRIVKLDGNENPYLSSPRAREVLAGYPYYHIYPDPLQRNLREALSAYTGLPTDCIVAANGSDELIDLTLRLFVNPEDEVLNAPPTFGMYTFLVAVAGARLVNVPRRDDFSLDLPGLAKAITSRTRLLFIASPNNPTGDGVTIAEVRRLLEMDTIVVVDEAYYEFSSGTVSGLVASHPNLMVLRTFSKWAGLAGLRIGYCLSHPRLTSLLLTIKQPYNVNVAGEAAAIASLQDASYLLANVAKLKRERDRLFDVLSAISWLHPHRSEANFVLCRVDAKSESDVSSARRLRDGLRKRGVLVRFYESEGLRDCLRISAGLPEDTDILLKALEEVWREL